MTDSILSRKTRFPLWGTCLILSFIVHMGTIGYFYFNPPSLQSPFRSLFGLSCAEPKPFPFESETDLIDKNSFLEEAFRTLVVSANKLHPPHDLEEISDQSALIAQEERGSSDERAPFSSSGEETVMAKNPEQILPTEASLEEIEEGEPSLHTLAAEAVESPHPQVEGRFDASSLLSAEPLPLVAYQDAFVLEKGPTGAKAEKEEITVPVFKGAPLKIQEEREANWAAIEEKELSFNDQKPTLLAPKTPSNSAQAKTVLSAKGTSYQGLFPTIAATADWDEDFEADVCFSPKPEGKGYLFAVSFTPNKDLSAHKLKHNFYFILDRSSSSQKHRFPVFKRATLKALAGMQPEDTFNIFIVDKKITPFRKENLLASLKNQRAAEEFLESQEARFSFERGDIYASLTQLLSLIPDSEQMHTAILLTDGQGDLSMSKKRGVFREWLTKNEGRVFLYTAAIGQESDLLSLDLLSTQSGGHLLYSDTHASFPRKLAKLILDLKTPLVKEVDFSIRPRPAAHIEFYPASYTLSALFANEPYVVLGEIDQLVPFDLTIEGRHNDDWIKISKKINFEGAKAADPQILKLWKRAQASIHYARFLEEGKSSHLAEAKEALNHAQKEIPFR